MGIVGRKETERRLRIMARVTVDMERGIYQWPDGRKPFNADGSPVISKAEIARSAGYSGTSNQRNMDAWFGDPFYKRQCEIERARRDLNLAELMENEENLPLAIARGLFEILLTRMVTEPESITSSQILTFAPQLHKYGLELYAHELDEKKRASIDAGRTRLSESDVKDMTDEQREQALTVARETASGRVRLLESAVAKARAIEEHDEHADALPEDTSLTG